MFSDKIANTSSVELTFQMYDTLCMTTKLTEVRSLQAPRRSREKYTPLYAKPKSHAQEVSKGIFANKHNLHPIHNTKTYMIGCSPRSDVHRPTNHRKRSWAATPGQGNSSYSSQCAPHCSHRVSVALQPFPFPCLGQRPPTRVDGPCGIPPNCCLG